MLNLTTVEVKHSSRIVIPNYNQQDATFLDLFISTDALHVSGGSSAHHQEHITVHTAPDDGQRNRLKHVECL